MVNCVTESDDLHSTRNGRVLYFSDIKISAVVIDFRAFRRVFQLQKDISSSPLQKIF